MDISLPSGETLAIVGGIVGQLSHVVNAHSKSEDDKWTTFRKWVICKPVRTAMSIAVNVGLIAACPVQEVTSWLQAIALLGTYLTSGAGANAMVNKEGDPFAAG